MPFRRRRFSRKRKYPFKRRFFKRRRGSLARRRFRRRSFKSSVLRALSNRPKPEIKFAQSEAALTRLTTAAQQLTWTGFGGPVIALGTNSDDRIGNKITLKGLKIWGRIYLRNAVETNRLVGLHVRILIVKFKENTDPGDLAGALVNLESVFGDTNGNLVRINDPYMPRNSALRSSDIQTPFLILRDKTYKLSDEMVAAGTPSATDMSSTLRTVVMPSYRFKFRKVLQTWSTSAGDNKTNGIWVFMTTFNPYVNTHASNTAHFDFSYRLAYSDA